MSEPMTDAERVFWEEAYCASLSGLLACPIAEGSGEDFARYSAENADLALAQRRKRMEG